MPTNLYWKADTVDQGLGDGAEDAGRGVPRSRGTRHAATGADAGRARADLQVSRKGETYTVTYGSHPDALRGVGTVLADLPAEADQTLVESCPFTTLGIMLDCSRNAVMTVEHVKGWLRRLALMGYNMVMLYTEDTYKLPGEPFFGYLRGAYSPQELKELDDYADRLGIEMIGCIQTLGHLEQILKWNVYRQVKDTSYRHAGRGAGHLRTRRQDDRDVRDLLPQPADPHRHGRGAGPRPRAVHGQARLPARVRHLQRPPGEGRGDLQPLRRQADDLVGYVLPPGQQAARLLRPRGGHPRGRRQGDPR